MSCTRKLGTSTALYKQSAAHILKTLNGSTTVTIVRPTFVGLGQAARTFSSSQHTQMKEFFPKPDTPNIRATPPAWPHPVYKQEEMEAVRVAHRNARTVSDKVAVAFVRTLRWGLDLVSGYRHGAGGMNETKYMMRNIFLESVAGVPGMCAGMLRHLRSMRTMQRDNGWMESLLEESYNERMHLLTFLKMAEPGWFMRLAVLATQGVFFNAFFVAYLVSPKTAHRFVGYLEEEAVLTYTRQIEDLDAGRLPMWEKMQAPDIAVSYWNMPEGHRTMRDLLLYIRADESKHREVNHTLGNLDQQHDPNPYVSEYKDQDMPHPRKDLKWQRPEGWEREDTIGKL